MSGTVNIAGSDDRMSSLGTRAVVNINAVDFPYHDRFTDPYAAERVDGTAQTDEGGYDPATRGTFWGKFKKRFPNYAGRGLRIITGYLDGDVMTEVKTLNYVMTNIDGPDDQGHVSITAKDVLDLADNEKAVAPAVSQGYLGADIDEVATEFTLSPAGIGATYATSGFAVIGSEIVSFTRASDVVTIVRGQQGTTASTHTGLDTFQECFSGSLERIDTVLYQLLSDYAGIDDTWLPTTRWADECDVWAPSLNLSFCITQPTKVATLVGELAALGVSIFSDPENHRIDLKINRPPDTADILDITDRNNIISVASQDMEDDRLSRVAFYTVQIDPTKSLSGDNFARQRIVIDVNAEAPENYGGTRTKEIFCRWLNHGDDATVRILSRRLLNRFKIAPVIYEIDLDAVDDMSLTDVIRLNSRIAQSETGASEDQLVQVFSVSDIMPGHRVKVKAQRFAFDGRYGYITEDSRSDYDASNAAEKTAGVYFVDETTLLFSDGTGPYQFI